jgi:predicted RND superfamily exporter protein
MEQEFTTFGTASVMVDNITYEKALELQEGIEGLDGVKSVAFDDTEEHYASASALFTVTFVGTEDDEESIQGLANVKEYLKDYDLYVSSEVGNPLKTIINQEMTVVDAIAVFIVVAVLFLTSQTYAEIPVLLITFGAAAILNMGTNFLMGEISFVTNSIAIVMQLALAIDYAIILCHRYTEEREHAEPREAVIKALSQAIPEISASSMTTISGLLAMCLMQFKLGYDMGSVLIKAILLSMVSVFLLMPGLLVVFAPWIDKTHHKNFVPKIDFLGKAVYATRFVMPVIFVVLIVGAMILSGKVNYVYSSDSISSIRTNEAKIAAEKIESTFKDNNVLAVIVPTGDYEKEAKVISEIQQLPAVESVTGLANVEAKDGYYITSAVTPREFSEIADIDVEVAKVLYTGYAMEQNDYGQIATNLDNYTVPLIDMFDYLFEERKEVTLDLDEETSATLDDLEQQLHDAKLQLKSDNYSRMVVYLDLPVEGDESYEYLDIIHGICARYYDDYLLVGDTTSCSDLRSSFEHDNTVINVLTVVFVIIVLIFTFKSAGLPVLLIAIIQGSIWINFAIPYVRGVNLYFLSYLIVSSIQMGANIDYAIVISNRYMELKEKMPLKQAMTETLNLAFPTIITSGAMLALAGAAIGLLTSNEIISSIGVYLSIGTAISIFLVMCVLPQILLMGDIIIEKTSFTINRGKLPQRSSGVMRIDGHVRGHINGYVDGEIHGFFRGDLNGMVDVGGISPIEPGLENPELTEGEKE